MRGAHLRRSLAIAVALLLANPSLVLASDRAKEAASDVTPLRVIDAHTHTVFSDSRDAAGGIPRTEEQYFKEWSEAGVVGAVAHTTMEGGGVHDLQERNVIYCAGIGESFDKKRLESGLETGQYGCLKIYLGYAHRYAYDEAYDEVYELAEKYGVPVVFHTGDTYSPRAKVKYADPLTIDEVAVDHPKVSFVIAHCGNPWIQSAAEVAYKNKNVYLECSAFLVGNFEQMPKDKIDTYMVQPLRWVFGYVEDPSKVMFGTDWPLVGIKQYLDAYKRAIPEEHWQQVFYENAARVFNFKRQSTQDD